MTTHPNVQSFNLCPREIEILDACAADGGDFEEHYEALRQAAFDFHWDGETPEDEWKEEAWQQSHASYKTYIATHPAFLALQAEADEPEDGQSTSTGAAARGKSEPVSVASGDETRLESRLHRPTQGPGRPSGPSSASPGLDF